MEVGLVEGPLSVNKSWTGNKEVKLPESNTVIGWEAQYTFEGIRQRSGRDEGVLHVTGVGSLREANAANNSVGKMSGKVGFDWTTGRVLYFRIRMEIGENTSGTAFEIMVDRNPPSSKPSTQPTTSNPNPNTTSTPVSPPKKPRLFE
jgi:hypothetical protein